MHSPTTKYIQFLLSDFTMTIQTSLIVYTELQITRQQNMTWDHISTVLHAFASQILAGCKRFQRWPSFYFSYCILNIFRVLVKIKHVCLFTREEDNNHDF